MFHTSAQIHDTIFAVGGFILFLAILPAVLKKSVLPLLTCYITGGVLFLFVLNYISMNYWEAVAVECGNVLCWAYLFLISLRTKRAKAKA